jgi:hypothetical protein
MEKLTNTELDEFKIKLRNADKAGDPSINTIKMRNFLYLLGDKVPAGAQLNGDVIINAINKIEARGVEIPGVPWKDISNYERRTLQPAFDAEVRTLSLPFLTARAKPATASNKPQTDFDDTALLKSRVEKQKQLLREDEMKQRNDPYSKVLDSHRPKGKLSAEDQKLYDRAQALKRKR